MVIDPPHLEPRLHPSCLFRVRGRGPNNSNPHICGLGNGEQRRRTVEAGPTHRRPPARHLVYALGFAFTSFFSIQARARVAAPGDGQFLAGIQTQGPASSAPSAVFHNPAMLADLSGLHAQVAIKGTWTQQLIATPQGFTPGFSPEGFNGAYNKYKAYNHLGLNGFIGASFLFDDFAIAAAWYSLDNRSRSHTPRAYRGFVQKNPSLGCELISGVGCAQKQQHGGHYEHRSELSIALAWQSLQRIRFGLAIHFPRHDLVWTRRYSAQQDPGYDACRAIPGQETPDPSCETLQEIDVRSRFRWFGRNDRSSRLLFVLTTGIAFAPNESLTLGARFRFRPNFGARPVRMYGTVEHCVPGVAALPETGNAGPTLSAEQCIDPSPRPVQMSRNEGRQLALGMAWRFALPRPLQLDAQVYWLQSCATRDQDCKHRIQSRWSALDFEAGEQALVDRPIYRGLQDRFGTELWLHDPMNRARAATLRRLQLNVGLGAETPGVEAKAHNVVDDDGWRLWGAASTAIEIMRRKAPLYIVPGYALQWSLPRKVGSDASFEAQAWSDFQSSMGDIDTPAGKAMLEGRARQSNAGAYSRLSHNLSVSLRWGELR